MRVFFAFCVVRMSHENAWTAVFTGKGGTDAEQELFPAAVEAVKVLRSPAPDSRLFDLTYHQLWERLTAVGNVARAAGIPMPEVHFSPHLFGRTYATALQERNGLEGHSREDAPRKP
jgi:hypothetical protein